MSNTEDNERSPNPAANTPKGEYPVGYCRPPVRHRFKHGNKANPKGRKKGTRNRKIITHDLLFETITVREGGEIKQMSVLEAVLKKTLSRALAGDNKAGLTIVGIAQKEGILTSEPEQAVDNMSETDLAIMEDVKRRLEAAQLPPPPSGQSPNDAGLTAPFPPSEP